jgi:adenine-specific DNA glycosylase
MLSFAKVLLKLYSKHNKKFPYKVNGTYYIWLQNLSIIFLRQGLTV